MYYCVCFGTACEFAGYHGWLQLIIKCLKKYTSSSSKMFNISLKQSGEFLNFRTFSKQMIARQRCENTISPAGIVIVYIYTAKKQTF